MIDESRRSVIVFDGRLRFGRINPEVAERMRRAHQRHQEALSSQETDGQVAILKVTDESAFHIMLSDFLRIDSRGNCERPMTVQDFADDVAIEEHFHHGGKLDTNTRASPSSPCGPRA